MGATQTAVEGFNAVVITYFASASDIFGFSFAFLAGVLFSLEPVLVSASNCPLPEDVWLLLNS